MYKARSALPKYSRVVSLQKLSATYVSVQLHLHSSPFGEEKGEDEAVAPDEDAFTHKVQLPRS